MEGRDGGATTSHRDTIDAIDSTDSIETIFIQLIVTKVAFYHIAVSATAILVTTACCPVALQFTKVLHVF